MDDTHLDLNLLRVMSAIADSGTVSGAALALRRGQPSVSVALGRLRRYFGDPLFIRSGNVMTPTPRGAALVAAARNVLGRVASDVLVAPQFDPSTTSQAVSLALSDVGEVVFLPALLRELRAHAPATTVRSVSRPPDAIAAGLETGEIDLAIGYFPDLTKHNFFQQALFVDGYRSLVRTRHPLKSKQLTLRQYLNLEHVLVRAESRSEEVFERFLAKKGLRRRAVLTTPHFASALIIVAQSDLIVTVPDPLARYFCDVSDDLRIVELPFTPPPIKIRQFWHRRFHHDPRNRWLRNVVHRLFKEDRAGA